MGPLETIHIQERQENKLCPCCGMNVKDDAKGKEVRIRVCVLEACENNDSSEVSKVWGQFLPRFAYSPLSSLDVEQEQFLYQHQVWATWFSAVPWTCSVKPENFKFKGLIYLAEK